MAIGGGEIAESEEIIREYLKLLKNSGASNLVVMTVASDKPAEVGEKYKKLFGKHKVKNIEVVDLSEREDAFDDARLKKIEQADSLFFSGGDQLHITSFMGGTPMQDLIEEKRGEGLVIAGTSAGAAMMSTSMIQKGDSNECPRLGGISFAPGLDLITGAIIDTHFSQRGRYGRLLAAVAHHPQELGIGLDEKTAIIVRGNEFRVVGEGSVVVMDGNGMKHTNLPYAKENEPIGIFEICTNVLPSGYKYDLKKREPISPSLKKMMKSN
jgi:cyanophycinase